jgi:hypothetical protein|tara:strand:+ start:52 stop:519 length:468 start_codon:yes stop_codon:yes gene_type:complete
MAHFAKIDNNNVVLTVLRLDNQEIVDAEGVEQETLGQNHLQHHHSWPAAQWIKTSYNTQMNKHKLGGTAFRGNYAAAGYVWHPNDNIFLPPQPYSSWTKDLTNATWVSPIGAAPSLTEEQQNQNTAGTHIWYYEWNESSYQADNTTGWDLTDGLA